MKLLQTLKETHNITGELTNVYLICEDSKTFFILMFWCVCVQVIGEDYVKDLMQLQKLNDLVDDNIFIRDVAKVKQVWTHTITIHGKYIQYHTSTVCCGY